MLDPVCSTTWPRRHWHVFSKLADLIAALPVDPTIVIVGPGGVARPVRPFLREASQERASFVKRGLRNFPRFVDQILRRVPGIPLVSLEPGELDELITRPHRFVVVDISRRVLAAVMRDYPTSVCYQLDIAGQPIPAQGEVVIAYGVITRASRGDTAMAHVTAAVKPGGLLVVDDRSAQRWLPGPPQFVKVDEQIYGKAVT